MKLSPWAFALLCSCTLNLETNEQSDITCRSDGECPAATFCNLVIERCVAEVRSDQVAPGLVSSSVTPSLVGPGTSLSIAFSTDEELRQAPSLELFDETVTAEQLSGSTYRLVIAVPVEGVSGTQQVRVTLVDSVGNAAEALVGEFAADFDAPEVADLNWDDPADAALDSVVGFGGASDADARVVEARVVDEEGNTAGLPELSAVVDASGATAFLALRGQVRVDQLSDGISRFAVELILEDPLENRVTARGPFKAVDRAEPDTRLDTTPPSESNRLRASFNFSSPNADVVAYECSLDGAPYIACESPYEERVFAEGAHSFAVRAIDAVGFVDPSPARYAWNEARLWAGPGTFSADCAIASDGTLWCWDALTAGVAVSIAQTEPVQVGNEADWLAVVSSNARRDNHITGPSFGDNVCGIREEGGARSVWCWGIDIDVGGVTGSVFPVRAGQGGFASLSLSGSLGCGIKLDGALWCWGDGSGGQLGHGTFEETNEMVRVGSDSDWTRVSVAARSTCGIRQEGLASHAYCWGRVGVGDPARPDGVDVSSPERVGNESDWLAIATTNATGRSQTCGIRADGGLNTLWCYGERIDGGFNETPTREGSETGWVDLQASSNAFCALREDRSLWCWGETGFGFTDDGGRVVSDSPVRISAASDWLEFYLNTGKSELCAFSSIGELNCRGGGESDAFSFDLGGGVQVFAPVNVPFRWASLSVPNSDRFDENTMCGIADGTGQAYCWGTGLRGGLRQPENFVFKPAALDAGPWRGVRLDLTNLSGPDATTGAGILDGDLYRWGAAYDSSYSFDAPLLPVMPSGDWKTLSSGNEGGRDVLPSYCATRETATDPALWCWGENMSGQLGLGDFDDRSDPVQVGVSQGYELGWIQLSQGPQFVCGIRVAGSERQLYCWGSGDEGRLGNGSTGGFELVPARVGTDTDWLLVSAASNSACGLRGSPGSAELWCWGAGASGELGDGMLQRYDRPTKIGSFDDWVHLESSPGRRCGTRANGTLWCWGENTDGHPVRSDSRELLPEPVQVQVPGGSVDVFIVGATHACAQTDQLYCWGESRRGLLGFDRLFGPVVSAAPPSR
ncbi:MAG: hypothetical protein AAF654_07940 [Myxococcota bacterium]